MRVVYVMTGTSYLMARPWTDALERVSGFDHENTHAWYRSENEAAVRTFTQRNFGPIATLLTARALTVAQQSSDGLDRPMPTAESTAEALALDAMFREDHTTTGRVAPARIVFLTSGNPPSDFGGALNAAIASELWREVWAKRFGVAGEALFEVRVECVAELDPKNAEAFVQEGAVNLVEAVRRHLPPAGPERMIDFNVTGGFKGVVPLVELIAIACGGYVRYLYELARRPVSIPLLEVDRIRFRDPLPAHTKFIKALRSIHDASPPTPPGHAQDRG